MPICFDYLFSWIYKIIIIPYNVEYYYFDQVFILVFYKLGIKFLRKKISQYPENNVTFVNSSQIWEFRTDS